MDTVCHVVNRNIAIRPAREERAEQCAADLAVKAADSIDCATSSNREIGHIEWLVGVGRICSAECKKIVDRDAESLRSID